MDEKLLIAAGALREVAQALRTGQDLAAAADRIDEAAEKLEAVPEAAPAAAS